MVYFHVYVKYPVFDNGNVTCVAETMLGVDKFQCSDDHRKPNTYIIQCRPKIQKTTKLEHIFNSPTKQ